MGRLVMNLEGVEKTMLLTLFAKAKHSQQQNQKKTRHFRIFKNKKYRKNKTKKN